jgi:hypothetical protein
MTEDGTDSVPKRRHIKFSRRYMPKFRNILPVSSSWASRCIITEDGTDRLFRNVGI